MVDRFGAVFMSTCIAVHLVACTKQPEPPEIPLLEPGLWTFEIETRREGQPVGKRTIRDCVGLRGLYSADRPTQCRRNEAVRSPDGSLTVSLSCEIEPKPRTPLPEELRGRGPLDLEELGLKVESRSVFSGDLRRAYVRDNTTTLEWPPGERQTTRSVTRGTWRKPTCPADLPPDQLERWLWRPAGVQGIDVPMEDPPKPWLERSTAPKMRAGLWTGTVSTRIDGGAAEVSPLRFCVAARAKTEAAEGAVRLPRDDTTRVCKGIYESTMERTSSGFTVRLQCALPASHLMTADLDIVRPALRVVSRSDYRGDTASRFEVAHDTTVIYASGKTDRIITVNRVSRAGDCDDSFSATG